MNRGALLERLRRADEALKAERLPPSAVHRVARKIDEELADTDGSTRMPRWVPMATFVGGAALVLAVLALGGGRRSAGDAETGGAAVVRDAVVRDAVARDAVVRGDDCRSEGAHLSGRCDVQLAEPAMTIHTARADVELHGRVIDVHGGRADFDVQHVHDAPVRVRVPGGDIVVVGTRFRVTVDADTRRGTVVLYEGRLRFEGDDGEVSPIEAGETFAFGDANTAVAKVAGPDPASDAAASEAAFGAQKRSRDEASPGTQARKKPRAGGRAKDDPDSEGDTVEGDAIDRDAVDVDAVIGSVDASRRSGDYHGAADALRVALRGKLDPRAREVLSYELGTILSGHLGDAAQACAHWQKHRSRFPAGRYAKQVARARADLGCE